jgi:hypothetical protein
MKKLSLVLLALSLVGFAGSALAKVDKSVKTIRHCGCTYDYTFESGTEMLYHDIETSGNSKGHGKNHVVGSFSDCWLGTYTEVEEGVFVPDTEQWMRSGDDCLVDGIDGTLADCDMGTEDTVDDILEGTDCGDVVQSP